MPCKPLLLVRKEYVKDLYSPRPPLRLDNLPILLGPPGRVVGEEPISYRGRCAAEVDRWEATVCAEAASAGEPRASHALLDLLAPAEHHISF